MLQFRLIRHERGLQRTWRLLHVAPAFCSWRRPLAFCRRHRALVAFLSFVGRILLIERRRFLFIAAMSFFWTDFWRPMITQWKVLIESTKLASDGVCKTTSFHSVVYCARAPTTAFMKWMHKEHKAAKKQGSSSFSESSHLINVSSISTKRNDNQSKTTFDDNRTL